MPIKILHTADLHIGDKRYGRFDPERSINTRLDDQLRSLLRLVEIARDEQIDAAVVVGDIYHGRSPNAAEEDVFAEFISGLAETGAHIFVIEGNHERATIPGKASPLTHIATLRFPNFHHISEPKVITVETKHGKLTVAGMPWPLRRELIEDGFLAKGESPIPEIWDAFIGKISDRLAERIPSDSKAIFAGHLWVSNVMGIAAKKMRGEPICRPETVARPPFDYVALGHIHKHQALWDDPPVVYSGSIERTDFSEADIPKGAVITELGETTRWKFIRTPARRFIDLEMNLSGMSDPIEAAAVKLANRELEGAIVRLSVTQVKGDRTFDARHLRPKFPELYYLRVSRIELSEERTEFAIRTYSPLEALSEYIDRSETLKPDKEELMELAKSLAEEICE
jgi:exonuclease SbcD